LLARTLRPTLDEEDEGTAGTREIPVLEKRETFLDELPNLQWASVWLRTKPDAVVRSWPLWQNVCDNKKPAVLVSMPLAALALACGKPNSLSKLERQLNSPAPGSCLRPPERTKVAFPCLTEQSLDAGEEGRIL